jgi:hypothetical protein
VFLVLQDGLYLIVLVLVRGSEQFLYLAHHSRLFLHLLLRCIEVMLTYLAVLIARGGQSKLKSLNRAPVLVYLLSRNVGQLPRVLLIHFEQVNLHFPVSRLLLQQRHMLG